MKTNELLEKVTEFAKKAFSKIKRYQTVIFIVFIALLYSFLVFQVNSLSGRQPSDNEISAQLQQTTSPHINQQAVDKIKQLQDNSVQVKTLFNQARKDPFSE